MTALNPNLEAVRKRQLGAIHIGKKKLGLDDDSYRAMLQRLTGKRSAAALGVEQLAAVIEEMRRLGFSTTRRRPPANGQARLIAVLWAEMYREGIVKNGTAKALDAFVKRQAGVEALEWLTPEGANKVIEALKSWRARGGKDGGCAMGGDSAGR